MFLSASGREGNVAHTGIASIQDVRTLSGEAAYQQSTVKNFEISKRDSSGARVNLGEVGLPYCVFSADEFDPNKSTLVLLSNISGTPRAYLRNNSGAQTEGWFSSNFGVGEDANLIDLNLYNVICFDYLGGSGVPDFENGGKGSARHLGDASQYVSLQDTVNLQARILSENFGLDRITVMGGSLGGICAIKYLNQDFIDVEKVIDISSPGVLPTRARGFFRLQQKILERNQISSAACHELQELTQDLPHSDTPGFQSALRHVLSLFENFDIQTASDTELLERTRQLSFLFYLHPNGINERYQSPGWTNKGSDNSMKAWLTANGATYAQSVCIKATACLSRMIADFEKHDADEIIGICREKRVSIARFGLIEDHDTLFSSEADQAISTRLKTLSSFSHFLDANNVDGHDHFLRPEFTRKTAPDLKVFLEKITCRIPNLETL